MNNKKKLTTTAVALATSAALLLGGTFAWQSINQTALNESSDVVNPGGRLHDDFDGENKDVYVENFAEEPIYARIRLEEYFGVVLNQGTPGEKSVDLIGTRTPGTDEDGNTVYDLTYETYLFDGNVNGDGTVSAAVADGESYWSWTVGGETVFMPTFNKNKDSRKADINGEYLHGTGVITDRDDTQYSEMETYTDGEDKTANAVYDIDSNRDDEIADADLAALIDPEQTNADTYDSDYVKLLSETHTAKPTATAQLISMEEWFGMLGEDEETGEYLYDVSEHGNYWVYDTDGWVYWSAPIPAGEATGLLLNGIELTQVMDESWFYAINVVGQFVTPDDTGVAPVYSEEEVDEEGNPVLVTPGTGFYDTENGSEPTGDAELLLSIIGVTDDTPGYEEDEEPEQSYAMTVITCDPDADIVYYLVPYKTYEVIIDTNEDVTDYGDSSVTLSVQDVSDPDNVKLLRQGTDYEISDLTPDFTERNDEQFGYIAESTIKILNEDLVGEHIRIKAVANASGNTATNEVTVQWVQKEIALSIYDATGSKVAGTGAGSTVEPNSEYDFSASIVDDQGNELVIFSTLDSVTVSDRITVKGLEVWVSINDHHDDNYVATDESGNPDKLVVGDAETFDNDEWHVDENGVMTQYDNLTLAFDMGSIKIYESAEAMAAGAEPIEICTAYGQWDLYPTGQESYEVQIENPLQISQSRNTVIFNVMDGNDRLIDGREDLTVAVTGSSADTTVEFVPADEYAAAHYLLTVGEDETETELTVTASDSSGSGSKTVQIEYLPSLYIGGAVIGEQESVNVTKGQEYRLNYKDFDGVEASGMSYALSGANDSRVEDNVLYVGAEENGSPMTLTLTVDGRTVEYYLDVTAADEEDPWALEEPEYVMVVQAFNGNIDSPKEYFNDEYNDNQLDSSVLYVTSFVATDPNYPFEENLKIAVLDVNGNEMTNKTVGKILYLNNNPTEDGYNWSYTGAISGFTDDDVNNAESAVTVCFYYEVDGVKYGVKSEAVIYDGTGSV